MFEKYTVSDPNAAIKNLCLTTFSYTRLDDEPSFLHSHNTTEIIVPLTDHGQLVLLNKAVSFRKRTIYIINPHIMHTEISESTQADVRYFAVKMNISILNNHQRDSLIAIECEDFFDELISLLTAAKKNFENGKSDLASLELHCFALLICDKLDRAAYSFQSSEKEEHRSSIINEVRLYIINHCGSDIKISDLCARFNISHNALLVRFHQELKMSPKEYLTYQRLNSAAELLKNTDLSVTQISMLCGFDSPAYFAFCFKKRFGVAPRVYKSSTQSTYSS